MEKKRFRKIADFWNEVGAAVGHSGPETETLFKNLHTEYQRLRITMHLSGAGTVSRPTLRNLDALFVAYESFYSLFYPQGGSAVPALVMTENQLQFLSKLDSEMELPPFSPSATMSSSAQPPCTSSSAQPPSTTSATLSAKSFALAATRHMSARFRRRAVMKKRLSNTDYLSQTSALQTRLLQTERQKVRALQEISATMSVISTELITLRAVYSAANGIQCTQLSADSIEHGEQCSEQ